jgi:putative PIN family toxin of toxin-antitoxin system
MSDRRVVLDTNVLISRLLLPGSIPGRAVRVLIDQTQPLVSEQTLRELATTLARPKFDRYVSSEDRRQFFELFARVAEAVVVTTVIRACREPRDNQFLELAVDGKADWIITGDGDLLELTPFGHVLIMPPAAVLLLPELAPD